MIILQIIGEKFGGMENSLYLYDNIYMSLNVMINMVRN